MWIHQPNAGSCGFVCILKHANFKLFDTESEDQTGIHEMTQVPGRTFPSLRGFSNLQVRIQVFIPDPGSGSQVKQQQKAKGQN